MVGFHHDSYFNRYGARAPVERNHWLVHFCETIPRSHGLGEVEPMLEGRSLGSSRAQAHLYGPFDPSNPPSAIGRSARGGETDLPLRSSVLGGPHEA